MLIAGPRNIQSKGALTATSASSPGQLLMTATENPLGTGIIAASAREGARAAVVGADADARAQAAMIPVPSGFSVAVISTCPGDEAEIAVSAPFDWMFLGPAMSMLPGASAGLPPVLDSTAVMACT